MSFLPAASARRSPSPTSSGKDHVDVGYVRPDADGFVTIKAGPLTVVVSDLHGNFEGLDPSGADVVVLAGDIAPLRRDFEKIPNTIARTIWC